MMVSLKERVQSPDVIYTQKFTIASVSYLKYTERTEAVDIENDFNLNVDNNNVQKDPDEIKASYLGYTDRDAATQLEDGVINRYPTFTDEAFNLDHRQHDELESKLKMAAQNKSLMWQGVVSFDSDFLERIGAKDLKTGKVDQRKIKAAVQKAMPQLLRDEGLDNPNTFWWGDIHLNKEHTHVHVTISQTRNTRPLKDGEPKGTFKRKSFRKFKSHIHHSLATEKDLGHDLDLEKQVDNLQHKIKDSLATNLNEVRQQLLLNQIYQSLPDYEDKRKWRASNNSYEFRESKILVDKYVKQFLEHDVDESVSELRRTFAEQDSRSRKKYGQHIPNTVEAKQKELHARLANQVFTQLRSLKPQDLEDDLIGRIKLAGIKGNQELIDVGKKRLKSVDSKSKIGRTIKYELGLRRNYVRVENLRIKNQELREQIAQLQHLPDSQVKEFYQEALIEQQQLNQIKMTPNWQRTDEMKSRFKELSDKYFDVQKISIDQITQNKVDQRQTFLNQEELLVLNNLKDPVIKLIFPDTAKEEIKSKFQVEKRILEIKLAIQNNNHEFRNDQQKRNKLNGPLFKELNGYDKKVGLDKFREAVSQLTPPKESKKVHQKNDYKDMTNPHKVMRIKPQSLSRINRELKRSSRKDIRALNRLLRDYDELEMLDYQEERENNHER